MPNHAHATIIGHAGRDAESRYLPNGDMVTEVSVAVSSKRKDKETSTWWKVVVFGRPAEWAATIAKGDVVFASGQPEMEEWTDREGNKRQTLKLLAREIVGHGKWQKQDQKAEQRPEATSHTAGPGADMDDDIPW